MSIAEERAKVLAEHTALLAAFPQKVGVAVYVKMPDGEVTESYTKSLARMHGDVAVVDVADVQKNPVLLSWVQPLARQPGDD
jgi:hypothetical protein